MSRSAVVPVLSLVLSLGCAHAPREAVPVLEAPVAVAAPQVEADRDGDGFLDGVDPIRKQIHKDGEQNE